jgi:hypothetical protein
MARTSFQSGYQPCSSCGARRLSGDCVRCWEREIAMRGSDDDWRRFEEEEKTRLRSDIHYDASGIDTVPLTIALVGCGKAKRGKGAPASDLYVGSLFKLALDHAERTADDVHILSALHGLVQPFQYLEPYNMTFSRMFIHEHDHWGQRVVSDIFTNYPMTPLRIVFYAGQQYIRPFLKWSAHQMGYWTWENPLEGLDLFQRLAWFRERKGVTS